MAGRLDAGSIAAPPPLAESVAEMEGVRSRPELEIWIVRHGETDWNQRGIIQGQSESTLSDLGAAQARLVATALEGISWWRICSSDLERCRETTKLILTPPPSDASASPARGDASDLDGSDLDGSDLDDSEPEEGAAADSRAAGRQTGTDDLVMHVGSHTVRLDPRLREMSAGIYEGLPRGTAYKKAVAIKAQEAGLSVEAFTLGGNVQVHEDPAQFRARAASFLDWAQAAYLQELSDREELGAWHPSAQEHMAHQLVQHSSG